MKQHPERPTLRLFAQQPLHQRLFANLTFRGVVPTGHRSWKYQFDVDLWSPNLVTMVVLHDYQTTYYLNHIRHTADLEAFLTAYVEAYDARGEDGVRADYGEDAATAANWIRANVKGLSTV